MKSKLARAVPTILAAMVALGVLAACSDGESEPLSDGFSSASGDPAPRSDTPAGPVDVCANSKPACMHVADADIDGDGTLDQVGIATSGDQVSTIVGINGARHEVKMEVPVSNRYTEPADIYRGAFLMSRAVGADIALHLAPGQGNAEQFAVISWDGAQLVALPQPPTADRTGVQKPGVWYLGSSHGKRDSIKCGDPGEIVVVRLTAARSEGQPIPGGGRREENSYTFVGNAWQPAGSNNQADTSFSYNWDAHRSAFQCDDQGTMA